jgi:FkbM family methyltransferase
MPIQIPVLAGAGRGHRFDAHGLRTSTGVLAGRYEEPVLRFLVGELAGASTFVDVGAHTGYFTRVALRVMPTTAKIVAFEPDSECRARVATLAQDSDRIFVRSEALGATDAEGTLVLRPGSCSRLAEQDPAGAAPGGQVEAVSVRTLDSLLAEGAVPEPDVLKIDVEGAELDVLEGAASALQRVRGLVVECHSMPLLRGVLGLVLDAGFTTVQTTAGGDQVGPPTVLARRLD